MKDEINDNSHSIPKGDTALVESFLRQPGGRKYLENITLILINALPQPFSQKEELYEGFVSLLNTLEQGYRQQEGQALLQQVFQND